MKAKKERKKERKKTIKKRISERIMKGKRAKGHPNGPAASTNLSKSSPDMRTCAPLWSSPRTFSAVNK